MYFSKSFGESPCKLLIVMFTFFTIIVENDTIYKNVDMSDIFVTSLYNGEYIIGDMSSGAHNGLKSGISIPNKVVIPYSINGEIIKALGTHAFSLCQNIHECEIKAKIHTLHYCAFFGCQNLKNINIPSSVMYINSSALDGRIDQTYPSGPINIYFEPKSKLKSIENAGISNHRNMNVFIYDKINIVAPNYMFGGVDKLTIFSRYSYLFVVFKQQFRL